jgi:hypothetical protein
VRREICGLHKRLPACEPHRLTRGTFDVNQGMRMKKPVFDERPIQGFFNTIRQDPSFPKQARNASVRPCVDGPPIGKGFFEPSATLVGAAMSPTCLRGTQSRWP